MSYVKRNWHEYNKNLVNRSNLFLWMDSEEEKAGKTCFFFFGDSSWMVFKNLLSLSI